MLPPLFRGISRGVAALTRPVVAIILWAWLALLLFTHLGARSPYSYGWAIFGGQSGRISGAVVNPDSSFSYFTTYFLYDGVLRNPQLTQNLRLPLHSFTASIVVSYIRSYLVTNWLINFAFVAVLIWASVRLGARAQIDPWPLLVALMTVLSLPMFVTYIGQPLHYTAGTATNFLVILALVAMREEDVRNPWIAGAATAVLTLSYDPYVFLAAAAAYVCFVVRFRTPSHYAIYFAVAFVPRVTWQWFVDRIVDENIGAAVREAVLVPLARGWFAVLQDPVTNALTPFVATHIGMRVAAQQVIALIYWPALILTAWGLYRFRDTQPSTKSRLVSLLALFFLIEQLVAAAFDWENNPRRAVPVVLALGFALCWIAQRGWALRRWRVALMAVLACCALLSFADMIFRNPVFTYLGTAQAMSRPPKEALAYQNLRLTPASMPALMSDDAITWHDVTNADPMTRDRAGMFAFVQVFNAAALLTLFWLLARSELLPRKSWMVVCAIWAVSLIVRFV